MLALPAQASAAPDRTAVLSASATKVMWDGGPTTGFPEVGSLDDDDTLLDIKAAGKVTVTFTEFDDTNADIDMEIYKADDKGEPVGEPIATSGELPFTDETATFDVPAPGKYLVRAVAYLTVEGFYKGTATIAGAVAPAAGPAPAPAPGGQPAPAPAAQPASERPPTARVTRFSRNRLFGTAFAEKGIRLVELGLVQIRGRQCAELNRRGRFVRQPRCGGPRTYLETKGTKRWAFSPRRLRRGTYVVYVRVTDTSGRVGGARRTIKVK